MTFRFQDSLLHDLRDARRGLARNARAALLAATYLALAIAGNVVVYAMIYSLIWRPLPFADAERLVLLEERERGAQPTTTLSASPANFLDWRELAASFTEMAGFQVAQIRFGAPSAGGGTEPEQVNAARVTVDLFATLKHEATPRGRTFLPEDGVPGAPPVVILAHRFWQERLGGDPQILGHTLELGGAVSTVVGVLPESFEFITPLVDVYQPLVLVPGEAPRDVRQLLVVARLAPGATMTSARTEMDAVAAQLEAVYPEANRGFEVGLINFRTEFPEKRGRLLFALLQGAMLSVLLIACANITNLMLARGESRRRELALRLALGARPWRILRLLLLESTGIAVLGGAAGLGLAAAGVRGIAASTAHLMPAYWTPQVDRTVAVMGIAFTLLAGLLVGVVPALRGLGTDPARVLAAGGRSGGAPRRRLIRVLVIAEVALALALLGGGSVLVRTFQSFRDLDPGYRRDGLVSLALTLDAEPTRAAELERLHDELLPRLAGLPGVDGVTLSSSLPQSLFIATASYHPPGEVPPPGSPPPQATHLAVSPGYFATLDVPLLAGRAFDAADRADQEPVVMVSATLAERQWGEASPLGRRLVVRGEERRVVGVVPDVWQTLQKEVPGRVEATLYVPLAQHPASRVHVVVRAGVDPDVLADPLRREIRSFDPHLAMGGVTSPEDEFGRFFAGIRIFNVLLGGFGALALALAALGVYGVLAYGVEKRRREIGVRLALGARPSQVVRMVEREGWGLALIGIALGTPAVVLVARAIAYLIPEAAVVDTATLVGIAVLFLAVTELACWLPASRAATVEPTVALRED